MFGLGVQSGQWEKETVLCIGRIGLVIIWMGFSRSILSLSVCISNHNFECGSYEEQGQMKKKKSRGSYEDVTSNHDDDVCDSLINRGIYYSFDTIGWSIATTLARHSKVIEIQSICWLILLQMQSYERSIQFSPNSNIYLIRKPFSKCWISFDLAKYRYKPITNTFRFLYCSSA